jgi:hypothetical protein
MSDADIIRATGIALPFIAGVRASESGGNAAAVRFEPHLFRRAQVDVVRVLPRTATDDDRRAAWAAGAIPYTPRDGVTGKKSLIRIETNREAYERAAAIDPVAAVRSTSWGAFQVLGGALLHLFPGKPPSFAVEQFDRDPAGMSDRLLIEFLLVESPRALAAAKAGDVDLFIHHYNGCAIDQTAHYRQRFDPAYGAARLAAESPPRRD